MKTTTAIFLFSIILISCKKESVNQLVSSKNTSSITTAIPRPDHVVVVILENKRYDEIFGNKTEAPFINAFKNDTLSTLFSNSFGVEHPSQPNYLDLFSGDNQGNTDDGYPSGVPFTTDNLARQLIDAGLSFSTFCEDMPYSGYDGTSYADYDRKHNPVQNWVGDGTNQVPASCSQPFTSFPTGTNFSSLPTVSFVIPNEQHNMHDGSISEGDAWLKANIQRYRNYCRKHNSLLILTFDEAPNDGGDNHIFTLILGQKAGFKQRIAQHINHYNVLRTIEDMYGLPYAGNANNVVSITNCWR